MSHATLMLMQECVYLRIRARRSRQSQVLQSLANGNWTSSVLFGLVCLLPTFLAARPLAVVLEDAQTTALLAVVSLPVVLADARPAALLAHASSAVVLADARPAALLALASLAVVLADARPAALLALAPSAVVLADTRPAALPAHASSTVVLADARPAAFLAQRLCSQMLEPPHCLQPLLWRLCSQMLDPPHCLQPLLMRLCSQMPSPLHCGFHSLKIWRCSHVLKGVTYLRHVSAPYFSSTNFCSEREIQSYLATYNVWLMCQNFFVFGFPKLQQFPMNTWKGRQI
jgi:hypothetical protein